MVDRPGMASLGKGWIGEPTKPSPRSALRPRPNKVRARPVATWLLTSVSVRTPKIRAISMPARAAAAMPAV